MKRESGEITLPDSRFMHHVADAFGREPDSRFITAFCNHSSFTAKVFDPGFNMEKYILAASL